MCGWSVCLYINTSQSLPVLERSQKHMQQNKLVNGLIYILRYPYRSVTTLPCFFYHQLHQEIKFKLLKQSILSSTLLILLHIIIQNLKVYKELHILYSLVIYIEICALS